MTRIDTIIATHAAAFRAKRTEGTLHFSTLEECLHAAITAALDEVDNKHLASALKRCETDWAYLNQAYIDRGEKLRAITKHHEQIQEK